MKKQYKNLAEIRQDKKLTSERVSKGVVRLKSDVKDCFLPSNSIFLDSSNKYMNYIGYAITAYKTASSIKSIINIFKK
ncbi:MAG: hypothetical protein KBT29_10120 [Prevotellaceae bacterium]|nr:hypothetical protein [Candidatus Minthosoma caballi]